MEYLLVFVSFFLGFGIGKWIEGARWRRNAKELVRIYSRKRLYKVEYGETHVRSFED